MNGSDEVFGAERPRLVGLAYRILASYADAEDVVQETWIRWQGADHDTIERPAAYPHLPTPQRRQVRRPLRPTGHHVRRQHGGAAGPNPMR